MMWFGSVFGLWWMCSEFGVVSSEVCVIGLVLWM